MKNVSIPAAILACIYLYTGSVWAQEPPKHDVQLRFDEAQQEEVADVPISPATDSVVFSRPFACKLNRQRVSEAKAYDAVTLWNVRKVATKNRRMQLSDTTRREKVRLLKFFVEKNRKKGVRPHLLGNIAGVRWESSVQNPVTRHWQKVAPFIGSYTLRSEYDSLRRAGNEVSMFKVPEELWRELPRDAVYVLDGVRVPGGVFQFIDGLILRTLDVYTGPEALARGYDKPLVVGDTYPNRVPLVVFNGDFLAIDAWLKMCLVDAFSMSAEVPMHYFYMLPLEAVQTYGKRGMYGAICIDISE